jgi:voltage-gated potassium channel
MRKRVVVSLVLLSTVIITGTLGYTLIEGWDLFDSFYMTIVTLTTIGYEEVHRLSRAGRVFNVFMIVYGVGVVAYTVNFLIRFILEGEIQDVLGRRSMKKKLKKTKDHYIVCGYGRMGHIICKELASNNIPFVVIEKEPVELDEDDETLIIRGDATIDDVLLSAGIATAKGLISVLSSDAHNLFVVLSARGLNAKLQIVARACDEGAEQKLVRAGADRVMSPYHIGGLRIAHTILKPSVVDFIEFATKSGNIEVQMEEVVVAEGSKLAKNTIEKAGIGRDLGIIIVAIKKGGEMRFNPTHKTEINAGDTLIALGEVGKLKRLEEAASGA